MKPQISCIITCYNNKKTIKKAINSVLNQTITVDEIIVTDDCSTDGSQEYINEFVKYFHNIKTIYRDKNVGVSLNRDLAIKYSKGDLISTLDGDDWFYPDKIENEFREIKDSVYSISYSSIMRFILEEDKYELASIPNLSKFDKSKLLFYISSRVGQIPRDMLFSKKLYMEIGGFDSKFKTYEDWDFKIRLAAHPLTTWKYSGNKGTVRTVQRDAGLSAMSPQEHVKAKYRVLKKNQELLTNIFGYYKYYICYGRIFHNFFSTVLKKSIKEMISNL